MEVLCSRNFLTLTNHPPDVQPTIRWLIPTLFKVHFQEPDNKKNQVFVFCTVQFVFLPNPQTFSAFFFTNVSTKIRPTNFTWNIREYNYTGIGLDKAVLYFKDIFKCSLLEKKHGSNFHQLWYTLHAQKTVRHWQTFLYILALRTVIVFLSSVTEPQSDDSHFILTADKKKKKWNLWKTGKENICTKRIQRIWYLMPFCISTYQVCREKDMRTA